MTKPLPKSAPCNGPPKEFLSTLGLLSSRRLPCCVDHAVCYWTWEAGGCTFKGWTCQMHDQQLAAVKLQNPRFAESIQLVRHER